MTGVVAVSGERVVEQLPNGVTLYLDRYRAPTASFALYLEGGTQLESTADNGVTHLLEHVLFKGRGPDGRPVVEVAQELGAQMNAFTWWLGLCAHVRVVRELADEAADLLCWQVGSAEVSADAVEEERRVVHQELMRSRTNAEVQVTEVAQQSFFGAQGLGLPILGTADSIAALTCEQVVDRYRSSLCGRRLTLIATGDFDVDRVRAIARRRLQGLPAGTPVPPQPPPRVAGPQPLVTVPMSGLTNTHLMYCIEEAAYPSPQYFATMVRAGVIADETRAPSRLRAALVDAGLAVDVTMRYQGYSDLGTSFLYVCVPPAATAEVDARVREILAAPLEPRPDEVEGATARIVTRVLIDSETTSKRALMLARTLTGRHRGEHVDDLVAAFRGVRTQDVAALSWSPAYTCAALVPVPSGSRGRSVPA